MSASIASIYRYPVKGLSPQQVSQTSLEAGRQLLNDRRYAIENGPIGFDPSAPRFFAKTNFLALARHERLAALRTHFDDDTHVLTIRTPDRTMVSGDLETAEGRAAIEAYFAEHFSSELRGPPKILSAPGHTFSDLAERVVSIINLASVADLERITGKPVDPLRFRANVYVTGWPAWHEFSLVGATLKLGEATLKVMDRIVRCAATNVDPVTAARDMTIPQDIIRTYGHADCGVYATVIADGTIREGDAVVAVETGAKSAQPAAEPA